MNLDNQLLLFENNYICIEIFTTHNNLIFMKLQHIVFYVSLLFMFACTSKNQELVIKGKISHAKGETVFLRKMVNQQIQLVDSVKLSSGGKFKFKTPMSDFPEFYFLKLAQSGSLTLLSDSSDMIEINSDGTDFLGNITITGNKYSEKILDVDRRMKIFRKSFSDYEREYDSMENEDSKKILAENMLKELDELKEEMGVEMMSESASFYAYYILYQKVSDNYLLFDPYSAKDSKLFAGVANVLNLYYPEAPRTKALLSNVKEVMAAQRAQKLKQMIDKTAESLPDFEKADVNGKLHRLTDLKGQLVLLNYWASGISASVKWNAVLKSIYGRYHSNGLEVYQVSLDKSKLIWEDALAAQRLPWITVCDFEGASSDAAWKYNVKTLPTTFLISREGRILGKYDTELDLRQAIKKNI